MTVEKFDKTIEDLRGILSEGGFRVYPTYMPKPKMFNDPSEYDAERLRFRFLEEPFFNLIGCSEKHQILQATTTHEPFLRTKILVLEGHLNLFDKNRRGIVTVVPMTGEQGLENCSGELSYTLDLKQGLKGCAQVYENWVQTKEELDRYIRAVNQTS